MLFAPGLPDIASVRTVCASSADTKVHALVLTQGYEFYGTMAKTYARMKDPGFVPLLRRDPAFAAPALTGGNGAPMAAAVEGVFAPA